MKKEDLTVPALILEALDIILGLGYIGLQIFYGIYYRIPVWKFSINVLMLVLVYIGLTLLSNYPERVNRIPTELCVGRVRVYSLRMIRIIKFIFLLGLIIPCVFDALGTQIKTTYSLIVTGIIVLVSVFYEYRIIRELRNNNK